MQLDDQPVGGGSNNGGSSNPNLDEQPGASSGPGASSSSGGDMNAPLEQKLVSKNWQARAKGFEELTEMFKQAKSPQDDSFRDHCGNWKKYLADANPGSLEKCLDALNAFIDKADPRIVSASQNEIIKALVEKCLGHNKPSIKTKGQECFLLCFEVSEVFAESIETMVELLASKNQKISQTAMTTLTSWLSVYGVKNVQLKSFLPLMEQFAASTVPATKNEALNFYRECYRWLGDGPTIQAVIKNLKKQQIDDLEKDFKDIKEKKEANRRAARYTRTEKFKAKDRELDEIIKQQEEEEKGGEDPGLDLFEPSDILVKYDADWQDKFAELKKWDDRKKQFEQLYEDANQPKIKNGDFNGVVAVLKKYITDPMVAVSHSAIKACGPLARGLKKDFEPHCKTLIVPLLLRFKEKKTQIIEEVHVVLESFMQCINIEGLKDDLIGTGLSDKAPSVKKNTCTFLEKLIQKTYIDVLQRVSGDFLAQLMKMSEDPDQDVRNCVLMVIGIFKGRLGEAAMSNYLKDMISQKLDKVNEAAKTVQPSKYDRPEKKEEKKAPPALANKGGAAAKKAPAKAAPQKQSFEEEPIPVQKKQLPPPSFEDMPLPRAAAAFDEMPIGGGAKNMPSMEGLDDEKPLPRGAYNLDALGDDAFGGGAILDEQKPKKAPPARFANKAVAKKPIVEEVKEKPEQVAATEADDVAMVEQPQEKLAKRIPSNTDELPIGGAKNKTTSAEEITPDEDKPLPKGAYNLDALGEDAFPSGSAMSVPKKAPPARFANKMKSSAAAEEDKPDIIDAPIKPAQVSLDDVPIGGNKQLPPPEQPGEADEDKPLPRGAYNLDALGDDAFGFGAPPQQKKAPPARLANKTKAKVEEPPIKPAVSVDDIPIGGKQPPVSEDAAMEEDKPLPRGAYNLDALGDDAFGMGAAPPKKGPPARLANKPKPKQEEDAPIKPVVALDDMPIGGAKPGASKLQEEAPLDEEKPLPRGAYNLDALGDDAFGGPPPGGPKKNPPPRLAKAKPVDEEMKDDSAPIVQERKPAPKKEEEKKAPAKAAAKPGASAAGPKGPQIQEEDTGAGLSKEEAEAKVVENFPADVVANFEDSKKWNEKVEGFKGIASNIAEMNPGADVIEGVIKFVKMKTKDWKESNINIVKEAIALFTVIAQSCERLSKRSVFVIMPFLSDKLGDVKVLASVSELLLLLSEVVTPKYVAMQIIKYGSTAKSPKIIQESCTSLLRMTDDFGVMTMPLKEMIDFGIIAANNSNAAVRTQAMALFAIMYKHAGEAIKNFLKDIKESTMKLIDEEFAKVTPFKKGEFQRKRNFKGEAAFEEKSAAGAGGKGGAAGGGGLDDLLPRQDISKLLTPKLMPLFKDNDWKKRKEAADKVEEMLKGANMRIQPVGLNELMDNIKQRMNDANKAVLKAYIQLIVQVVEALGPNAKQFSKKILPPMLQSLSDKQSLVRADVVTAMDKWAEHCGAELIISMGGPMISQDNPELRTEMLQWIIKNKDSIKLCGADALKEITKPLVECLSDKTPAIRNLTDEVICSVMPLTGYPAFQAVLANLKPAVQNTIKPILEKVKNKVGASAPPPPPPPPPAASVQVEQPQVQQEKKPVAGPTLKQPAGPTLKPQIKPKEVPQQSNLSSSINDSQMNQSIGLNSSVIKKKDPQGGSTPSRGTIASSMKKEPLTQAQPAGPKLKQPLAAPGVSTFNPAQAAVSEGSASDLIQVNFGFKEKRAIIDMKSRFTVEEIKSDQVEKLKMSTTTALGSAFCQKMFSQDFKLHCECIDAFNNLMQNQPESILQILDLIFKWSCVRLADSSNTKFAVNMFDFYASLFSFLQEQRYCLQEFEAAVIVPLLCDKTGISNNLLREKVRKLLRMTFDIYDWQKCYNLIVTYGFNAKNLNAQAECLDEIAEFIIRNGIDFSSEKEMRIVAKMADHASKNNRENALKLLGEAYKHIDDNIWRVIGDVTPKVQGLLEARFKKIKGLPIGLAPSASTSSLKPPGTQNSQLSSSYGYQQKANGQQNQMRKSMLGMQPPTATAATARNTVAGGETAQQRPGTGISQSQVQSKPVEQMVIQKQPPPPQIAVAHEQKQTYYPQSRVADIYPNIPGQTLLQDEDEDEDLRIFTNDDMNNGLFGNPIQDKLYEDITRHIHQLKYADLSKRVDSLVSLNEQINSLNETSQPVLIRAANDLINAFVSVMIEIFDKSNAEDINLRFAKYFIQIVLKTCSCKEIMSQVHQDQVFLLAEQLLTRLLIEGLDKVGENKEGENLLKNLNSSMLRILENCNHTSIICVLIDLQRKFRDYPQLPKINNLIVKCLLKLSKIIEKLIDQLDIEKILLSMHEYILVINHDNKTPNDENGIKVIKTIMNELVKLRRESIYDAYAVIKCHRKPDVHIYKWIDIILKSLRTQNSSASLTGGQPSTGTQSMKYSNPAMLDMELRQIVEDLKKTEKFEATMPRLVQILDDNPGVDLDAYLSNCSATFQKFVKNNLLGFRQSAPGVSVAQGHVDRVNDHGNMMGHNQSSSYNYPQIGGGGGFGTQRQTIAVTQSSFNNPVGEVQIGGGAAPMTDRMSKLQNMKERMSLMKSGAGALAGRAQGHESTPIAASQNTGNNTAPAQSHNMNTSFSAMNSSLSQKWMSKKQQIAGARESVTGLPQQHQMSSTMSPAYQQPLASAESQHQMQTQQHLGHSIGLSGAGVENPQNQPASQTTGGSVQNTELNKRLAEMKAKLQALKNQNK